MICASQHRQQHAKLKKNAHRNGYHICIDGKILTWFIKQTSNSNLPLEKYSLVSLTMTLLTNYLNKTKRLSRGSMGLLSLCLFSTFATSAQAEIKKVDVTDVTIPVMIRKEFNPVIGLNVKVDEDEKSMDLALEIMGVDAKVIKEVSIFKAELDQKTGNPRDNVDPTTDKLGSARGNQIRSGKCIIKCSRADLKKGDNHLWVSVTLSEKASIEDFVELSVTGIKTPSTRSFKMPEASSKQRIGFAITYPSFPVKVQATESRRTLEERTSKFSRIPGLTVTKKGTLIATFDNRYHHNGDLPADIDVAVSCSSDGGQTWSDVITCINARDLPGIGQGVGDPAILLDESNNRIWIAGLAAPKTGHPIWKTELGSVSPANCGQFILTYSDDEGKTWSDPINITADVKRLNDSDTAEWGCLFQGPGNGICMKDGTLVFPAQIWGKKHMGVLVYSKDNGKTWTSSKEMEFGGSETTVAELSDGTLMLNAREGAGSSRQVGITNNLGETWKKHSSVDSDRGRLQQPVCQAILVSLFNDKNQYNLGSRGIKHAMFFSNPNTSGGRSHMTLKFSKNNAKSWTDGLLYDQRGCMGYSAIYPIDKDYLGVFYEGQHGWLYFVKVSYKEIIAAK